MTTLSRGQYAPLPCRSSPVLRSTLPYSAGQRHVFLRNDLRRGRADYFAQSDQPSRRTCQRASIRAPPGASTAPCAPLSTFVAAKVLFTTGLSCCSCLIGRGGKHRHLDRKS